MNEFTRAGKQIEEVKNEITRNIRIISETNNVIQSRLNNVFKKK